MSADAVLYLVLGAFVGGFVNGLAGTGTALFALGFYLVVLEPIQAVAIVSFMSVLVGLQGLWIVRKEMAARPKRTLRFVIPGLFGVPLGLALLDVVDTTTLRVAVASFLIVYGIYFGLRASLPAFSKRTPWIDSGVGFVGGILGGTAAVSGALPQMWLSIRPWPKAETRAVLQPFNGAILSTTIFLLFLQGAYNSTVLQAMLITIPVGLVAAQVGIFVFKRLSDAGFRRLLIFLSFLMGVGVIVSEVF